MQRVRLQLGDITSQAVDAIVNAANEKLLGGGGVDGAIHRTAGPQLLDACRRIPEVAPGVRCPTGEARVTPGFGLPARLVIHTVGPVWQDGQHGEAEQLAQCYRNALTLAVQHRAGTVAFPAISCGVFGYPAAQAADIAVREIERFLSTDTTMVEIRLIAFDNGMHAAYQGVISRHL